MSHGVMAVALAGILMCWGAVDAHAQGMKGKRGMMGGGMEQKPPSQEEAGGGPAPEVIGAFFATRATREHMEARGFSATGLNAVYPADANCPVVTSPFASPARGDGRRRSPKFFQGLHGGIDIPVPEGTPIIAVADGTVVRKEVGESIGGIGMVVQHAPQDTGLPVWIYTEYKHLQELPPLDSAALRDLPDAQKATPIPHKTAAGRIVPEGTRVVWPLVCQQK